MADRRAGKIPQAPSPGGSRQPHARKANGRWRAKLPALASTRDSRLLRGLFTAHWDLARYSPQTSILEVRAAFIRVWL